MNLIRQSSGRRAPTGRAAAAMVAATVAVMVAAALTAGTATATRSAPTMAIEPAALLPAQVITDVAYADPVPVTTKGNLLDLYLPERSADEPVPLFIFTEGSAWFADTGKSTAGAWAAQLNPLGYAVAGVSIRSSFQVQFPGQLHDIKAAIRFLRYHASTYAYDAHRFAIGGFSSGAWTAAMAGVTNNVGVDLEGTAGVTGVSSRV